MKKPQTAKVFELKNSQSLSTFSSISFAGSFISASTSGECLATLPNFQAAFNCRLIAENVFHCRHFPAV
jgi:hypothetical protein